MTAPFAVKVQRSLVSSDGIDRVLIYDVKRTVNEQLEVSPELLTVVGFLSYWWAVIDDNGLIELQSKASKDDYMQFYFNVTNRE